MYLIYLILVINALGFILMGIDKRRARLDRWRIKERDLLTVGFLLGAVGIWAGMKVFHHKTRHKKFTIMIPAFLILHIILAVVLIKYLGLRLG